MAAAATSGRTRGRRRSRAAGRRRQVRVGATGELSERASRRRDRHRPRAAARSRAREPVGAADVAQRAGRLPTGRAAVASTGAQRGGQLDSAVDAATGSVPSCVGVARELCAQVGRREVGLFEHGVHERPKGRSGGQVAPSATAAPGRRSSADGRGVGESQSAARRRPGVLRLAGASPTTAPGRAAPLSGRCTRCARQSSVDGAVERPHAEGRRGGRLRPPGRPGVGGGLDGDVPRGLGRHGGEPAWNGPSSDRSPRGRRARRRVRGRPNSSRCNGERSVFCVGAHQVTTWRLARA